MQLLGALAFGIPQSTTGLPPGVPAQYQQQWNQVPSVLQTKLNTAVSSGTITSNDISTFISSTEHGTDLLKSAGFTTDDAYKLKSEFETAATSNTTVTNQVAAYPVPPGTPDRFAPYWTQIPQPQQAKLTNAMNSQKITSNDVSTFITSTENGVSLLIEAGFTLDDALQLTKAFSQ